MQLSWGLAVGGARSFIECKEGISNDIRFVLAHTRTRATAEEFCRDHDARLVDS